MSAAVELFPKGSIRKQKGELVVELKTRKGPRAVPISAFDEAGVCMVDGLRDYGIDDVNASPSIKNEQTAEEKAVQGQTDALAAREKALADREAALAAREAGTTTAASGGQVAP